MLVDRLAVIAIVLSVAAAHAQPASSVKGSDGGASRRFPQPVRVADLLHRAVLQAVESQTVLGHVRAIVRAADGTIEAVVDYGGVLGIGARPIAVPVNAIALLGQDVEIVDLKPEQLHAMPTFNGSGFTSLAEGDTIKVGLTRPSH